MNTAPEAGLYWARPEVNHLNCQGPGDWVLDHGHGQGSEGVLLDGVLDDQ